MDIYEEITEFYRGVQAEKRVIGTSVFGRNLYAFRMGEGRPVWKGCGAGKARPSRVI